MKKTIAFIFTLLAFSTSFASSPKYDAVYGLISKEYTLNADGSTDYHFRKELKLNTIATFDRYGETFILYNTEFQTLTINEAYTVRKDGSIVKTPANAFNPSLPYSCTDCERFNTIREMVVTHTALEIGATIVLDYTIHSKNAVIKDVMEKINVYENEPVTQYDVSFTMPADLDCYWECSYQKKFSFDNSINNGGTRTMRWSFSNLPQNRHEQYLPEGYLPTLIISTLSAQHYLSTIAKQNAFNAKNPELFTETLSDILKNAENVQDSVNAIRKYINDAIHTNYVEPRLMNHIFASAQTVWSTACGTPIEKDILFHAMLNAAGIPSSFGFLKEDLNYNTTSAVLVKMADQPELFTTDHQCTFNEDFISLKGRNFPAKLTPIRGERSYDINVGELTGAAGEPASISDLGRNLYALQLATTSNCKLKASNISRQRTAPVQVPQSVDSYTYTVTLPYSRCSWVTKPYSITQKCSFGSLNIAVTIDHNVMVITRELTLDGVTLKKKGEIQKLRQMLGEWESGREYIYQK